MNNCESNTYFENETKDNLKSNGLIYKSYNNSICNKVYKYMNKIYKNEIIYSTNLLNK